jgi:hypothetical protein
MLGPGRSSNYSVQSQSNLNEAIAYLPLVYALNLFGCRYKNTYPPAHTRTHTHHRYYVEMVLSNSSAEATGVVAKGDILEVVDEKSTQVVLPAVLGRCTCDHSFSAIVLSV